MAHETRRLAEYAAGLKFNALPAEVLDRARNTIADTIGAMIYGYELPWSRMIVKYAEGAGTGGRSRIMGLDAPSVQPGAAALANGALAHAFEMDGGTKPSSGAHPGATIFPALLATAQDRGTSGRAVLTAFVAATEVMVRIGRATKKSNEHRGFHAPGTTGPFGAAVGTSILLGLDAARISNAIGIAASLSSGIVQFSRAGTGGMVKRLHFGRAAESGVLAASLAAEGFTGPHDAIEGELGFLHAFCDERDLSALTKGLGETYLTLAIYMKRFPCHGTAQAPLQALEVIRAERPFSGADVSHIEVTADADTVERHNIINPTDATLAQYSVPFCIALACYRNSLDPRSFDDSALRHPDILNLSARVKLKIAELKRGTASVAATFKDGSVISRTVTVVKATPEDPPTQSDVYEKFALATRHCPASNMEELFNRVQKIENESNLAWISA